MKKFIFLLLFPMASFALTETQIEGFKNDIAIGAAACQEDSYLLNCYKTEFATCKDQVEKSYGGCVKFLQKFVTAKTSVELFENKLDSCLIRDVDLQWKNKVSKRTPACALPAKEAL
jgi:hypothetical protein